MDPELNQASYWRVNALIAAAFTIVILILAVTVWSKVESEYVQGILTLVLGRMLGYVDAIYNYEFGTTRSSAKKDDAIKELTKTAATVAANAQVTKVATDAGTQPTGTMVAGDVAIKADTVTVEPSKAKP